MTHVFREDSGQKRGYLSPEFIEERARFYVDRTGKKVLLGCGDDRNITPQSAAVLHARYPDVLAAQDGIASVFGAVAGIAKNAVIAGVAQYGPNFVKKIGGFAGAFQTAVTGMRNDNSETALVSTMHSAEGSEGNAAQFNSEAESDVACAYAMGVGATSSLLVHKTDSLIRDVARADQTAIFGDDEPVDKLLRAHQVFLSDGSNGQGDKLVVDRSDYAASKLPVMILAGSHTAAKSSGLINNFQFHAVRNSTAANNAGKAFYSQDLADVTAAALWAFSEYKLDAELLMRAFVLDSTPVRAVLAAGDADPELHGNLDPRNLPMGIIGSPKEALAALQVMG